MRSFYDGLADERHEFLRAAPLEKVERGEVERRREPRRRAGRLVQDAQGKQLDHDEEAFCVSLKNEENLGQALKSHFLAHLRCECDDLRPLFGLLGTRWGSKL